MLIEIKNHPVKVVSAVMHPGSLVMYMCQEPSTISAESLKLYQNSNSNFILGKREKPKEAKSGEQSKWGVMILLLWLKNTCHCNTTVQVLLIQKITFSSLLQFAVYTEIGNAHLQIERKCATQVWMLILLFYAIS